MDKTVISSLQTSAGKLRAAIVLVLLVSLSACATRPEPNLILLSNDAVAHPADGAGHRRVLLLRTVSVPEYLQRKAIVYRSATAEIKSFPDSVWAERLSQSVTRWIAAQLAADLPDVDVWAFDRVDDKTPSLVVDVDLLAFEPEALPSTAPELHLRGTWHLSPDIEGRISADVPMNRLDPESTVMAMRTALAQACGAIAQKIRQSPAS